MFFLKTLMIFALTINAWQTANYAELVKRLPSPTPPITTLNSDDNNVLTYISYTAVRDPNNRYSSVMHDSESMPSWLFLMHYKDRLENELWHRGEHFGFPCNVWQGNNILLHVNTIGLIRADIIFRLKYKVFETKNGTVVIVEMDKDSQSQNVQDFKMFLWAFPHPTTKNLTIVVAQGYIKTILPVELFKNNIKWHIDNMLQNFGERLLVDNNDKM